MWNSFFIHALILEHHESNTILQLAHKAESQAQRLQPALQERNNRMVGPGQEAWSHACDQCCEVYKGKDGQFCAFFHSLSHERSF